MSSPERPRNRLASEASPYLRQHATNPVDWYPWGPEAFEKARREGKPVFLSIGYSSCHWCHVMERESFENPEIARVLNERYVSVKVDREERPDVDDVYMNAVQLVVGRGGWPLSAFLLPDGRPFFGGTYFPPDDRGARAGFRTLLLRLSEAWAHRREELEETAQRIVEEVRDAARLPERLGERPLDGGLGEALTGALKRALDARHGGFGTAPKFPPHGALEWLLRRGREGDRTAEGAALLTLDAMALGGIHDHVGGGFHRYSTDAEWLVPHFEKMLTDNAQLLSLYAVAFAQTGRDLYRRVARGIADYLLSGMRGPEGGFYSATDADSEGEEGRYFVWAERELRDLLGGDAAFFCELYQVRPEGNYRDESTGRPTGRNVLHLLEEPTSDEERRLSPLRARLGARRSLRVPPGLDDKRVASANALAASGLSVAGRILKEPRYVEGARGAVRFLLATCRDRDGRLLRSWKDGAGRVPAFLEDEAYLVHALLDLAEADPAEAASLRKRAREAAEELRARFRRPGRPGFGFTGEGHEALVAEGRDLFDKAIPSAPGSAARALLRLAAADGDLSLAAQAKEAIAEVSGLMARLPHGTETWHLALASLLELEERRGPVARWRVSGPRAAGAVAEAALDPVRVRAEASPPRVARGGGAEVTVHVSVAPGAYLPAEGGLAVEVWAGGDVPAAVAEAPRTTFVEHEDGTAEAAFRGEVVARFGLAPGPGAALGQRSVSVLVRFRACRERTCEPERSLSLSLGVEVVR